MTTPGKPTPSSTRPSSLAARLAALTAILATTACAGIGGNAEMSAVELFHCLDGNGNDYLEAGELQHPQCDLDQVTAGTPIPSDDKERAEALLRQVDIDGDEKISESEFRAWSAR